MAFEALGKPYNTDRNQPRKMDPGGNGFGLCYF